jgi:hypothetical protein
MMDALNAKATDSTKPGYVQPTLPIEEARSLLKEMKQTIESTEETRKNFASLYGNSVYTVANSYISAKNYLDGQQIAKLHPDKQQVFSLLQQCLQFQNNNTSPYTLIETMSVLQEMRTVAKELDKKSFYDQFDGSVRYAMQRFYEKKDFTSAMGFLELIFDPKTRLAEMETTLSEIVVVR